MAANLTNNTILGTIANGQANVIAAWDRLVAALRAAKDCGLFLSRRYWYALSLKRMPAAAIAAPATCRPIIDTRCQRHQRWMSGVVVDPGTVGVG
jgi:hypothetical protein